MTATLKTISPVDGSVYVERPYAVESDIANALTHAVRAGEVWREVPLDERALLCGRAVDAIAAARYKPTRALAAKSHASAGQLSSVSMWSIGDLMVGSYSTSTRAPDLDSLNAR